MSDEVVKPTPPNMVPCAGSKSGFRPFGRPKGAKNKHSLKKVSEVLLSKNIEPIEELLKLIPNLEYKEQLAAWALIFKYTYSAPYAKPTDEAPALSINYTKVGDPQVVNSDTDEQS